MALIHLFPTQIYYTPLKSRGLTLLNKDLKSEAKKIRQIDVAGRQWSKKNFPGGYTSYSSMSELFQFSSTFDDLRRQIDIHVRKFAQGLDMDLKAQKLVMTNLWVNIVPKNTYHGLHLHPLSSISGSYYVDIPKESSQIKFEDPRLACFMGSVPRKASARRENQRFFSIQPKAGYLLLFESWLRHEVTQNLSSRDRISISFNYGARP